MGEDLQAATALRRFSGSYDWGPGHFPGLSKGLGCGGGIRERVSGIRSVFASLTSTEDDDERDPNHNDGVD